MMVFTGHWSWPSFARSLVLTICQPLRQPLCRCVQQFMSNPRNMTSHTVSSHLQMLRFVSLPAWNSSPLQCIIERQAILICPSDDIAEETALVPPSPIHY